MHKKKIFNKFTTILTYISGVSTLAIVLPITLSSCSSNNDVIPIPTTNHSSFTSINQDDLSPVSVAALSATYGRESLVTTYVNKLLSNWFQYTSNNLFTSTYNSWLSNAEETYQSNYDEYKNNRGANWRDSFQKNLLDPVGGTKELYIQNIINQNLKDEFINNLFKKNYISVNDNGSYVAINKSTDDVINNSTNINPTNPGEKNNFKFSAEAIDSNTRTSMDYGYADFMEFLMDEWVYNEFPLPISMSLWKNSAQPTNSAQQVFTDYFGDSISAEGSYSFQYFANDNNNQSWSTTEKFTKLITMLKNNDDGSGNQIVNTTTGLINLPVEWTEDESTSMTITFSKLFSGEIAIPFSSAALYKLNNYVFGILDPNVYSVNSDNINSTSIMKNFLVFDKSSNTGVFYFPYSTTYTNNGGNKVSVFKNEYQNAIGIRDLININANTGNSVLDNFILTRDSFGVHLIGIDRLSQLKAAAGAQNGNSIDLNTYKKVCNEIRNTFMYRYATDVINDTSNYNIVDTLKTYLTDNFEELIFKYVIKYVENQNEYATSYNLFGPKIVNNKAFTSSYDVNSNQYGFDESTNINYINVLDEIKNTSLSSLIKYSLYLKKAESILSFSNNLKNQIYSNQSSYNDTADPNNWITYGIAGVLPYTRNSDTGNFDSLINFVNYLIKNVSISMPVNTYNTKAVNAKSINLTSNSDSITGDVTSASDLVTLSKKKYEVAIVNYINSINLSVNNKNQYIGKTGYIFTNDEYINNAINELNDKACLDDVLLNFYLQRYLTTKQPFDTSKSTFNTTNVKSYSNANSKTTYTNYYDLKNNNLYISDSGNANVKGSVDWVKSQVNEAIKSTYVLSKFTSLTNLYSDGDWTTSSDIVTIANDIWNESWNASQYNFSSNLNSSITSYEDPTSVLDYYKFLITIEYLLDYNPETNQFSFTNLVNFLNDITKSNNRAAVGWMNMSSIKANPDFGLTKNSSELNSVTNVQNKVSSDSEFKADPLYLNKTTPYSWSGAPNYYDNSHNSTLSYTTDNQYWYTAPMSTTNNTANTGFVGFQAQNPSNFGLNAKLPIETLNVNAYANAPSNSATVSYLGLLYSYGTRENIINYVKTITTTSDLYTFYNNNLLSTNLPLLQTSKDEIEDIYNSAYNNQKFTKLLNKIVEILKDSSQVPNNCFQKMDGMPVWNNENNTYTTLFSTSDTAQNALKYEYVVSLFNNNDVNNLLNDDGTLNVSSNGFLGLNPITFFNAVVMLAKDNSILISNAYDSAFNALGGINIYDFRLVNMFNSKYVLNYSEWEEYINLN